MQQLSRRPGAARLRSAVNPTGAIQQMRLLVVLAVCGLTACGAESASPESAASPESPRRPNVILISIDTLRRDHVGHQGYERDTTPVLDALASESLVFERAYTTMSFTLIAHMSMLTGLYPGQHGVHHERLALPASVPTMAQRLKDRGYHTIGLYRPGWLDGRYGFDRGFDVYEPHIRAAEADQHLRSALERRPTERPLFLFVHLFDVHSGNLQRPGARMYEPPAPFDETFLADASERMADVDIEAAWKDSSTVTPEQHEAIVALYDSGIRYIDHMIGTWLDLASDQGWLDNSIVIVTSDHGESLNQRGVKYAGHGGVFEEGLRVPMLIRFPDGRFAGEVRSDPVSHVDLQPTLLDALGFPPDSTLPGVSLLSPATPGRIIYAERPGRAEVILRFPSKLVIGPNPLTTYLYDLGEDPDERRPLRPLHGDEEAFEENSQALREAARQEQGGWHRPNEHNPEAAQPSAQIEADLRALGYLGDD